MFVQLLECVDVGRATSYQLVISEGPQMSDVNKAAIQYLKAPGASAIRVIAIDGVCTFHAGHKIDPNALSVFWLPTETVAAAARPLSGLGRGGAVPIGRDNRATLKPNATAMARTAAGSQHLDGYMETLRKNGQLALFT